MSEQEKLKWALIGGGQMGRALVGGMLESDVVNAKDVRLVERNLASRDWWAENQPKVVLKELSDAVSDADIVLLAVKPQALSKVLGQKAGFWNGKLVVSVAAGVSLDFLCQAAGHRRVVRVMPNTPSLIGRGASGYCCGDEVTAVDQAHVEQALSAVGIAIAVNESQMDGVTGLSGSGPAYIYLIVEALADGGVAAGLPRALAMQLATQTVIGAAEMVQRRGGQPRRDHHCRTQSARRPRGKSSHDCGGHCSGAAKPRAGLVARVLVAGIMRFE